MQTVLLAIALTLFADLLCAFALFELRRRRPEPWMGSWFGAYLAFFVMHVCVHLALVAELNVGFLVGAGAATAAALFLVRGTAAFFGRRTDHWTLPAGALVLLTALGLWVAGLDPIDAALPAVLALVAGMVGAGVALMVKGSGAGRLVAGPALILDGLHTLDFPITAGWEWFVPWGVALDGALLTLVAVGFGLMYVDRAYAAAENRQEQLQTFVRDAVIGVYRSTLREGFIEVNPALVRMLGYETRDQVLALVLPEDLYLDPSERGRIRARAGGAGASGFEVTWKRRDGQPIQVELFGHEILDDEGKVRHWEGFARDVTEIRRLEAALSQSQRMQALGRMAGGIAHDFNNLLTVIQGNIALVEPEDEESIAELLPAAAEAADRAADLTRQLLTFGRPAPGGALIDLTAVVEDTLGVIGSSLDPRITVDLDLEEGCTVHGDASMLMQVVMNLALNAGDAMPEGGQLSLRTSIEPPGTVVLTVADVGSGIAPDALPHIFEPFFTTREVGRGTGLGLSTVFAIVEGLEGSIDVESELGEGTKFHVRLPHAVGAPVEPVHPDPLEVVTESPPCCVLIVEDEASVRKFVQRALERRGFRVVETGDPHEALRIASERPPDLVLSDVVMPGLSGPELLGLLREQGYRGPGLLMSGYPDRVVETHALTGPILPKPFTADALYSAIDAVLAETATHTR